MTDQVKEIKRYSISFKQKVVREIEEEGLSISVAARRYGIRGGDTIQGWLRKFGKNHLLNKIVRVETKGEKDRLKELEAENKKLKLAYADAVMQRDVLEILVDIANEHYGTDIKKNFGDRPFSKGNKKKDTR